MKRTVFTLIELLVVVAIIAILAAILLPALQRAADRAKVVACVSNMRQINLSLHTYLIDFDDRLPHHVPATTESYFVSKHGNVGGLGLLVVNDYLGNHRLLYCPDVRILTVGWGGLAAAEARRKRWYESLPSQIPLTSTSTACDYTFAWGTGSHGPPTTLARFSEFSWGYGKLNYWFADSYTMFDNVGYKKLSHPLSWSMNIAGTDGSVTTVREWADRQPTSGNAGYYRPFNDRVSWGFWRWFGAGRDM